MKEYSSSSVLNYKDCSPELTVTHIREILSKIGIFVREIFWRNFSTRCYAVTVEGISNQSCRWKISANGKGISPQFALASAYAELLERIQNLCCPGVLPLQYGLMNDEIKYPDEKYVYLSEFAAKHPDIIHHFASAYTIDKLGKYKLSCVPFFSVNDQEVVELPIDILYWRCMSNGMCAGNTPEEAIVQGICELFERFIAREIFLNDAVLPTINNKEIIELESYNIIKEIEQQGYRVLIKDCTLGGKFPVIGLLFLDTKSGEYHFHLGSDPVLDIALQRCLTETIQTITEPIRYGNSLGRTMGKIIMSDDALKVDEFASISEARLQAYYSYYRKSTSCYPSSLFFGEGKPSYMQAFCESFSSNTERLTWLCQQIFKENLKLFIRDVSFLEFPSFRVYIPGISEVFSTEFENEMLELAFEVMPRIRTTLLSLARASVDEVRRCVQDIEKIIAHPRFPSEEFSVRWHINFSSSSSLSRLEDIDYLLTLLNLLIGDTNKAFLSLDKYLHYLTRKNLLTLLGNVEYYWCISAFLRLVTTGASPIQVKHCLSSLFGDTLAAQVCNDLSDPRKILQYFDLPVCGNCGDCPASSDCRYDEWKFTKERIMERMQEIPIDQNNLSIIFQEIE